MTRRHDSKISAIFWGIILIFPIIWFVFSFIAYVQPFSDNAVSITYQDLDAFLLSFLSDNLVVYIFTQPFSQFLFFLVDVSVAPSAWLSLVLNFISYYIFVHLLKLAVDVILFIPHLFHSWVSKFDRKVE